MCAKKKRTRKSQVSKTIHLPLLPSDENGSGSNKNKNASVVRGKWFCDTDDPRNSNVDCDECNTAFDIENNDNGRHIKYKENTPPPSKTQDKTEDNRSKDSTKDDKDNKDEKQEDSSS